MFAALVEVPMAELGGVCEMVGREFPGITSLKHLGGAAQPGNTVAAVAAPSAAAVRFSASEGFIASEHHQPESHHANAHQKPIHVQLLAAMQHNREKLVTIWKGDLSWFLAFPTDSYLSTLFFCVGSPCDRNSKIFLKKVQFGRLEVQNIIKLIVETGPREQKTWTGKNSKAI
jgi:hypothetical protein